MKPSNDEHKNWVKRRLLSRYPNLGGKTIAVWGLTYKPGTDTLRRSLAVELCNWLLFQGACLNVHDPVVTELPRDWDSRVHKCGAPMEAALQADALVVATEWPLYREISFEDIAISSPGLLLLDANRFLGPLASSVSGINYVSVGTRQGGVL